MSDRSPYTVNNLVENMIRVNLIHVIWCIRLNYFIATIVDGIVKENLQHDAFS